MQDNHKVNVRDLFSEVSESYFIGIYEFFNLDLGEELPLLFHFIWACNQPRLGPSAITLGLSV